MASSSTTIEPMSSSDLEELKKKQSGAVTVKRKPDDFPNPISVKNAKLVPLFDDPETNNVWTVGGAFNIIPYVVSLTSTMTIHRCESSGELTVFNAFRCEESLEKQILELGPIKHVVKLGQYHGDADAYYVRAPQFNKPKLWALEGGSVAEGTTADEILSETNLPIQGAKLYEMKGHPFPECLMTVPCAAGKPPLLVACDSLIYIPDRSMVPYSGRFLFYLMGFDMQSVQAVPKPAPLWFKLTLQAVGSEKVLEWYQGVLDLEWSSFVGAHGVTAVECNREAMLEGVKQQVAEAASKE